jgi:hypothetical protein
MSQVEYYRTLGYTYCKLNQLCQWTWEKKIWNPILAWSTKWVEKKEHTSFVFVSYQKIVPKSFSLHVATLCRWRKNTKQLQFQNLLQGMDLVVWSSQFWFLLTKIQTWKDTFIYLECNRRLMIYAEHSSQ